MDAIRHPELKESPQAPWLTPNQVMNFEDISRQEVYRRMKPGEAHPLIWRKAEGSAGRLINPRSMSPDAQDRWRQDSLRNAIKVEPQKNDLRQDVSEQFSLLPEVQGDREMAAKLGLSTSETDEALRKLCAIKLLFNHDSVALGHPTKAALREGIAKQLNLTPRSVQRLERKWKQHEDLRDLVNKTPGPEAGIYTVLDLSARAQIKTDWLRGLTKAQIYRNYKDYIEIKANSPGCRSSHCYHLADRTTVGRFVDSLSAIDDAAREGTDSLNAACGHIDRSYLGLASLERVESDECKLNLFSYDPRRAVNRRGEPWIRRYWLLTFYDARSVYPLVWNLCEGSEYELRHGIAMQDEINLFVALARAFGVPAAIHSDRGRFRGREWGGERRRFPRVTQ